MVRKSAILCALLLALAGPAFGQPPGAETVERPSTEARVPNFLGITGLLYTPTAYTVGDRVGAGFFAANHDLLGGGVLFGISDRFEIGAAIVDTDNALGNDTFVLANAKFLLLRETDSLPAISVGVVDAFDTFNRDPGWFVVASKYFTRRDVDNDFALKGSIGYGGGIFDEELFASAELFFTRDLSAMAEYLNGDVNVGGRFHYRGWSLTLGLFDLDSFGGSIAYTARFR